MNGDWGDKKTLTIRRVKREEDEMIIHQNYINTKSKYNSQPYIPGERLGEGTQPDRAKIGDIVCSVHIGTKDIYFFDPQFKIEGTHIRWVGDGNGPGGTPWEFIKNPRVEFEALWIELEGLKEEKNRVAERMSEIYAIRAQLRKVWEKNGVDL